MLTILFIVMLEPIMNLFVIGDESTILHSQHYLFYSHRELALIVFSIYRVFPHLVKTGQWPSW